jgi:serine/threonine protein kinase
MTHLTDADLAHLRDLLAQPATGGTRYEIVRRIGEGGMGVVYLARDRELAREVALKVVRVPEPSPDERTRLLREARILASLEHPGIVPVHDAGELPDGRVFYVMKHVRGERLDAHARTTPLPELLRAFRQVCEAVAFAHGRGVLHRDLKPQNVMLGAFGEVLVLDWGVAKVRGEAAPASSGNHAAAEIAASDTATGTVAGTPGYMAPEQLAGAATDDRTDVYGLGGILHFLLLGEHPSTTVAPERWAEVPAPLRAICARARAADPAQRYASCSALADDVANYLAALPVSAHRERLLERARRVGVRYRTPILLVLAYLVMRVLLLVFA